jgi:DNA transformation protein
MATNGKTLKNPVAQRFLEQMNAAQPVSARAMFGGYGFYSAGGPMFALFAFDQIYVKVDDSNRPEFESAGQKPFIYDGGEKPMVMQYYSIPESAWQNQAELNKWMQSGIEAAARAATKKKS